MSIKRGIDVSHWQGMIMFDDIKVNRRAGYQLDFAILKAGGSDKKSPYKDEMFERNYAGFKNIGVPVGAYFFAKKGYTEKLAERDALHFLELLKGKKFEYPVFIDVEEQSPVFRQRTTKAVVRFCDIMEKNGYFVGIYASDISGFKEQLDKTKLLKYAWWVARYGREPSYATENMQIWQLTSTGNVPGISGRVDKNQMDNNICYPEIMLKKHLNGF